MTEIIIRDAVPEDAEACGQIAADAWAPVRASFREQVKDDIYSLWGDREDQKRKSVEGAVTDDRIKMLVAETEGVIAGFITFAIRKNAVGISYGEIANNAVAPDMGGRGIGTKQCAAAIAKMKAAGCEYLQVDTGLDDSHAPARRMYEKAGFDRKFEHVTYYMKT